MKGIGKIWFSVVLLLLLCACRTTKEECNMSDAHIRTNSAWHVVCAGEERYGLPDKVPHPL